MGSRRSRALFGDLTNAGWPTAAGVFIMLRAILHTLALMAAVVLVAFLVLAMFT